MKRRAFTLVELLVVIAIIGILMGLLLSAVQAVRQAAARASCLNNLKQIGLALHSYHDANGGLPAGCSPQDGSSGQPYLSWLARILPHLEQEALYKQSLVAFSSDPDIYSLPHFPVWERKIALYRCPADPLAQRLIQGNLNGRRTAFTSYLGITGTDFSKEDGLFFLGSATRFAEITDGLSNTLAVGERPSSADGTLGSWYGGFGQDLDGSANSHLGVREFNTYPGGQYNNCPNGPYRYQRGSPPSLCDAFRYWSFHKGGSNWLFADGSVRFLAYSADSILPDLATRAGGEATPTP
ncbi:MAG: DUF1559 domain-containing protein [Gemmataceae bacterium]|nr:DUF1559 domain-containing protein [Gemmataceae bacterium]